ncbi:hypothetical protein E2C01_095514 [Portunus trituberculatus]|uniref:Uncharacterized protein n=1 Tax=Portunus trituberculatus TaxID=210409 RepID=A0A5B7K0C4_PORTR|nr:hypothetical protein [Portunus trituberculatus]
MLSHSPLRLQWFTGELHQAVQVLRERALHHLGLPLLDTKTHRASRGPPTDSSPTRQFLARPSPLQRIGELHRVRTAVSLPTELRASPFGLPPQHPGGRSGDSPVLGRLSNAASKWPVGTWAGRVVRRGLSWEWAQGRARRLQMPPLFSSTSPQLSAILQEMLLHGVLEKYSGPVFLSRPFLVPRWDRQDPWLVVDLSALNAHIECHHFRMVMLKQLSESLLPHS